MASDPSNNVSTKQFSIRPATYSELSTIANILTKAFWNDELFGNIIHPNRNVFPEDNDLYWLRRARVNWWDWSHVYLVSVIRDRDRAEGEAVIAGVAVWQRIGTLKKDMALNIFDPRRLAKPLAKVATDLQARIWPNRAADPGNEDIIERSYHYLDHMWTGKRADSWYLECLGVHPNFQRQGHGRALVRWGFQQAEMEGVSVSVISGDGKEEFYRRCGFETQDGWSGMGEGNPLRIAPGGLIYWKDVEYDAEGDIESK
ncbi:acyl-CoA N-acyltransferase [Lojkania enalia]|uniref:Acyl-CoA N-acyltransferase n=1 Tax=Lojkania enalia TaxID=147567 RepID=A0A9P4K018_9PLEO|nr:acyl-CoA N-acyltransferase [Didymosphaeria enalia]